MKSSNHAKADDETIDISKLNTTRKDMELQDTPDTGNSGDTVVNRLFHIPRLDLKRRPAISRIIRILILLVLLCGAGILLFNYILH